MSIQINPYTFVLPATIFFVSCGPETPKPNHNSQINAERNSLETYEETEEKNSADADKFTVFDLFCTGLSETDLYSSENTIDAETFCNTASHPTSLFTDKLPSIAYEPGKDVRLIQIEAPVNDSQNSTTSMTVATAVKIPTTAKHYFDMMTVFMDDTQKALDLDIKLVDGQTKNKTLAEYASVGSKHQKGWDKHIRVETKVSDQLVISEYINRQDHWVIEEGKAYAISSYTIESIEGVIDGRMFTVLIQGANSAYLFVVIHTKTDNRGLPSVAQDQLVLKYKEGIKNAYINAEKIEKKSSATKKQSQKNNSQ